MLIRLSAETFEREMQDKQKPVLLACLHRDTEGTSQIEAVEQVAKMWQALVDVCVMLEPFEDMLERRLEIEGTPTFLLFKEGKIHGRLLGQADSKTLIAFLEDILQPDV